MFISTYSEPLTKCVRCGFKSPTKEGKCHYCHNLSDTEVTLMLHEHSKNFSGNKILLKRIYIVLVTILLCVTIYNFIK